MALGPIIAGVITMNQLLALLLADPGRVLASPVAIPCSLMGLALELEDDQGLPRSAGTLRAPAPSGAGARQSLRAAPAH